MGIFETSSDLNSLSELYIIYVSGTVIKNASRENDQQYLTRAVAVSSDPSGTAPSEDCQTEVIQMCPAPFRSTS